MKGNVNLNTDIGANFVTIFRILFMRENAVAEFSVRRAFCVYYAGSRC